MSIDHAHQATRAVPLPTNETAAASHPLAERRGKSRQGILAAENTFCWRTFSTLTPGFDSCRSISTHS